MSDETCNWTDLARDVIASLTPQEREVAIAYLEQRIIPAGEELTWAGITQRFNEAVVVAFIDLEPALNWTHRARYLILGTGGGLRQTIDADRPPFMTGVSPYLHLIHQGSQVPVWAVVTSPENS
ncbi:MAG: hypothetical protein KKD44_24315 [Proteobacteria bacterium]|nr:hypothetical protein [Pseudomonadota bacterium]